MPIARSLYRLLLLPPFLLLHACGSSRPDAPNGPAPTITAFTVTPAITNAGRSVELSWSVTGASSLMVLQGAAGAPIDVSGRTSYSYVAPAGTTELALQASNGAGSMTVPANLRTYDWSATAATLDATIGSGSGQVNGYSFALIDGAGALFSRAGGNIAADRLVALASATKLPTVIAILTLVDRGEIALDTPVASYLAAHDPDFVWPADKTAITMRMLLAHTSGLPGLDDLSQPACINDETGTTLRACAQDIANTTLRDTPGAAFNYGGIDFQVAAYIATLISGQSWQDFFQSRVATPLGLSRFTFGDPATVSNPRAAGGGFALASEYSEFLRLLLNDGLHDGTRVLSSAMVVEILRDQTVGLPTRYTPFPFGRRIDYPGYGLGMFLSAPRLHPGSEGPEWSDPGVFGTMPWIDLSLKYGAVLLLERDPADGTVTGIDIWDDLRPDIISQLTRSAS